MAHFAKIDQAGTVLDVIVVDNEDVQNLPFPQSEPLGLSLLAKLYPDTKWVQTSYNNNFRKCYAIIGGAYCAVSDGFIPPQPFPSFTFDRELWDWVPPIPYPDDELSYMWDEPAVQWVLIQEGAHE